MGSKVYQAHTNRFPYCDGHYYLLDGKYGKMCRRHDGLTMDRVKCDENKGEGRKMDRTDNKRNYFD